MRRLAIAVIAAALSLGVAAGFVAPAARAEGSSAQTAPRQEGAASDLAPVDVLQVSGLFDAVVVDAIDQAIDRAQANGSQALVLQLNTHGAVVSRDRMSQLVQRVADSKLPIGIWVGPSKSARAYGLPAQLLAVADVTAMVPGSRIGHIGTPLQVHGAPLDLGTATERLRTGSLSFGEARTLGALKLDTPDDGVPTIKNMVLAMDGVVVDGVTLRTIDEQIGDQGQLQRHVTLVRFSKLGLVDQLMHTVASPPVAYLLFAIGLALLIFEFFTAGVGIAGLVGAACTILGCYGLAALPARGWAIALLVVAMLAFAIDVQVGVPRLWTGVGVVAFIVGSWYLYRPLPGSSLRLGWITLVAGVAAIMLAFIVGMPSMVRTRFATPTIGREWMIGEVGTAVDDIDPVGVALVGEARWRARTNRATPLHANDRLRVVAIDGVTLEVEPEAGGARDYREHRGRQGPEIEELTPVPEPADVAHLRHQSDDTREAASPAGRDDAR